MDDEYDFSAPDFHDFGAESGEEEVDESYFDPRRVSQPRMSIGSYRSTRSSMGGAGEFSMQVATIEECEGEEGDADVEPEAILDADMGEEAASPNKGGNVAATNSDGMADACMESPAAAEAVDVDNIDVGFSEQPTAAAPADEAATSQPPSTTEKQVRKFRSPSSRLLAPTRAQKARLSATKRDRSRREQEDVEEERHLHAPSHGRQLTEPKSPRFVTSARASARPRDDSRMSSTSLELKKIQEHREKQAKRRRRNAQAVERQRTRSSTSAAIPEHKAVTATAPTKAPKLQTSARTRNDDRMSSTSRELMEIQKQRAELAKRRRRNQAAMQRHKARSSTGASTAVRSTKALTVPTDVPLHTSDRARSAAMSSSMSAALSAASAASASASAALADGKPHKMKLRSTPARRRRSVATVPTQAAKPTEQRPFNLATDRRARSRRSTSSAQEKPNGSYKSVAEMARDYQSAVPSRFHSKPAGSGPSPVKDEPRQLTEPQPFNLRTDHIHSEPHVKSSSAMEEEFMSHVKPFKARPFNKKIAESSGDLGVPKVPKKQLTQPSEFHLATKDRSTMRASSGGMDEQQKPFKARPIKAHVFEEPDFQPRASEQQLTNPKTPRLATKDRAGRRPSIEVPREPSPQPFKARPIWKGSAYTGGNVEKRPLTEPQPFNLHGEALHEASKAELQARVAKEHEEMEAARKFRARHVPKAVVSAEPTFKPEPSKRELTEPAEPAMPGMHFHEQARADMLKKIEQELEQESAQFSSFKAKPLPRSVQQPTFAPQPTDRPTTAPVPFSIHSDERAMQRAEYEEKRAAEESAARKRAAALKAQKDAEDAENLKQLRRNLTFKARPIKYGKSSYVHVSKKQLTTPVSPRLGARNTRVHRSSAQSRAMSEATL